MPIIRVNNYVEDYRLRSQSADLHKLAAREGRQIVTDFVNSQILERIDVLPSDVLVDIGCGDGCLLKKAVEVKTRIGTVGSVEERERLRKEMPGIDFKMGLAHALPLETESANKVVCNGVVMYLRTEDQVALALREICRIARRGASIWIGELPASDEYSEYKMYVGSSVAGLLWHCWHNHGLRTFLGMCRKLLRAKFGNEEITLNSAALYYSAPDGFVALAEKCGLRLETYFKHRDCDAAGKPTESPYRFDYIFRK